MRNLSGLTLIELLLASSLSLILLGSVYSIFLFSQTVFYQHMDLIHLQENQRMTISILSRFTLQERGVYFTAATERKYQEGGIIYALYKKDKSHMKYELVEGVKEISFIYDVLQDGKLTPMKEETIHDWSKVKGVSISFLLQQQRLKKRGFIYVAL